MKRAPLNRFSKKKCRKAHKDCENFCSQCKNPQYVPEYKKRKPINPISKKKRAEIEDEKPIREQLKKRANGHCEECGRSESQSIGGLHPHEALFRSHGGRMTITNSKMLCHVCHASKHGIKVVEH
jgi:5-methylcytosine-specific restriction endonuclease McrA